MRNKLRLLGLREGASLTELYTAFKKRAREVHPDQNPGDPKAADKFIELVAARDEVEAHIKSRAKPVAHSPPHNWNKCKKDYPFYYERRAGEWVPLQGGRGVVYSLGKNVVLQHEIYMDEAQAGVTIKVQFPKVVRCPACSGRYRQMSCNQCLEGMIVVDHSVDLPIPKLLAGRLRYPMRFEIADRGFGIQGSLFVQIHVRSGKQNQNVKNPVKAE